MSETALVKEILVEVSKVPGVRVWRQNTGVGYSPDDLDRMVRGQSVRPITYGVPGAADITGICGPGVRLEIEVKVGRKYGQTKQQKLYQEMIERHEGIYILAYSAQEAVSRVREAIANRNHTERPQNAEAVGCLEAGRA